MLKVQAVKMARLKTLEGFNQCCIFELLSIYLDFAYKRCLSYNINSEYNTLKYIMS